MEMQKNACKCNGCKKDNGECWCPCDTLSECTGIKKCNTAECTGYCVDLPHGIEEKEVEVNEKQGVVEVKYKKEVKGDNSASQRTGFYSFTIPKDSTLEKTQKKGSKLLISLKKK